MAARSTIEMPHDRILFIDAYDSFSNNIISLLEQRPHVEVTCIRIDDPITNLPSFLQSFTAVIAGPGPGDPRNAPDVGLMRELWDLQFKDLVPVLGVCLGFQSLVLAFGGRIDQLREPRHGVVRKVTSSGESIFAGIEGFETVQYHSLYASLADGPPHFNDGSSNPNSGCLDLRPLAWDCEEDNTMLGIAGQVTGSQGSVLMAVEHNSKPFWGIQFHPESICSSEEARKVIDSWWEMARKWRRSSQAGQHMPITSHMVLKPQLVTKRPHDLAEGDKALRARNANGVPKSPFPHFNKIEGGNHLPSKYQDTNGRTNPRSLPNNNKNRKIKIHSRAMDIARLTVPSICETLGFVEDGAIVLDSELHQRHDVGEYSIIGILAPDTLRLEYSVGADEVRHISNGRTTTVGLERYGRSIFSYLKAFMTSRQAQSPNSVVPFWGGLMGYISYEACLETVGIVEDEGRESRCSRQRPDLCFAFVERSIVIGHIQQKLYIQSIKHSDHDWVNEIASQLAKYTTRPPSYNTSLTSSPLDAIITLPDEEVYNSRVRNCQSFIRAGSSYELCLTTRATITTLQPLPPWPLYLRLRDINPSPFSAYLRIGNLTLLSSSPERFLRWSRPSKRTCHSTDDTSMTSWDDNKTSTCQFRPIKGTVQRRPHPDLPPLTLAEATALLSTPKERAENLMIVDLIRHDLHGVVGSQRVSVPKLMVVEEYATLFQLVSVVEGSLITSDDECDDDDNDDENIHHHDDDDENSNTIQNIDPLDCQGSQSASDLSTLPIQSSTTPSPSPVLSKSGIDVLASSLPPGSMTGAPKQRSCRILQSLENRPRGIYSGVLGYMDVEGGGDFSVVIRSAWRWDDDGGEDGGKWSIGAGGAVTTLSTPEGEWEEMRAKMESVLRLFSGKTAMCK